MDHPLASKLPLPESFSAEYLEQWGILPLEVAGDRLRVAVTGEPAVEVLEDLEVSFGLPLELVSTPPDELRDAIRRIYSAAESTVELVKDLAVEIGPSSAGGDPRGGLGQGDLPARVVRDGDRPGAGSGLARAGAEEREKQSRECTAHSTTPIPGGAEMGEGSDGRAAPPPLPRGTCRWRERGRLLAPGAWLAFPVS